ncbi:hypothetical protein BROUX41_004044 [Berkeleyomyces rouxiae]|uniref:uncharacterized protein n=1 Tax=Berkeleyomyces rouxiae TaxID=2035830 RepID=UPI003B7A2284
MLSKMALAMALMAASIARAGDIINSPLGIDSSGILRLSAAEATLENYSNIVNMRKQAEVSMSSGISTDNAVSNETDLTDVSNKGSTKIDSQDLSEVPLNADGTVDMEAWDSSTEKACQDALSGTTIASNPSGTGICYNLAALNITSGIFQADLRLYKISDPSGDFAAVLPSNIQVKLSYDGAFVSTVDVLNSSATTTASPTATASTVPRSINLSPLGKRDMSVERRENAVPLLKQYMLVGQIDPARMAPDMSLASLETLVMPILTLNAAGSTGIIQTNVSSNEALFVNGVFSREVVMSDLSLAMWAVEAVHAELANGTVAFVLPGMQLMIYPIGLGITSAWMVIGLAVYGFGTYERFMYAARYRRQKAMAGPAVKTF